MGREFYLFLIVFGLLSVVVAGDIQELKEGTAGVLRIAVLDSTNGEDKSTLCKLSIFDPSDTFSEHGPMSGTNPTSLFRTYTFTPPLSNTGRWYANASCDTGSIIGAQAFEFIVSSLTLEEQLSNVNSTLHKSLANNESSILSRIDTTSTSINNRLGDPSSFSNETGGSFQSIMDILRQIFFRQKRQLFSVSGTALNGTGLPIISGTVTSWLFNCTTTTSTCGSAIGLPHASIINNGAYSFQFIESTIPGYVYKVVSNVTGDDQSVNLTTFING